MKKFIIIPLVAILLFSCGQNQTNEQSDNSGNVVVDTTGTALAEKNLKSQLREYLVTYNGGDVDKAITYIYPDVFAYMKQLHPNDYDIESVKEEMREPMRKMKKLVQQKKVTYDFEIGAFTSKVDLGEDKIYTIIANINAKAGLNKHSIGQEIVSITNNNGRDWKFIELKNEMTEPILKMKFSDETVEKVLKKD